MKVLFVSEHCCSRVIKEGLALITAGVEVAFMQKRFSNPAFMSMLPSVIYYDTPEQLADKLVNMQDIQLIHVHNEPDWLGHICKTYRPDLPVVFDAHDLFSVRVGEAPPDEIRSFQLCDAFVYPSKAYYEHALVTHKEVGIQDKPNVVLYSYSNYEMICREPLPSINTLVYEGGLRTKEKEEAEEVPEQYRYHEYRDYQDMFTYLSRKNVPVTVFSANADIYDDYVKTGAFLLPPVNYHILTQALSRFSWGIVGGPIKHKQWDTAMPNKLFEYIAAGIPVIAFNASEVEEFVTKHNVGVVVENPYKIPNVFRNVDPAPYQQAVIEKRESFAMERQVDTLMQMYMGLI